MAIPVRKLILLELNELNFDIVRNYVASGADLPGMSRLCSLHSTHTSSEKNYEHLEPWIQWVSVHTGQTYGEHGVFRLGDIVKFDGQQIFDDLAASGWQVGVIGAMNARNRLTNSAYFVPDPWTQTPSDGSLRTRLISSAVSQAVNDNSKAKVTLSSIIKLMIGVGCTVPPSRLLGLVRLVPKALRYPWRKALFLDRLLYEIHRALFKKTDCDFSALFLNAGAHIQHHYFFNSSQVDCGSLKNPTWYVPEDCDPILEMLRVYDQLICDLLLDSDSEVLVATGLSQKPYDELKFYYRLRDHSDFLNLLGLRDFIVYPRMTRDFLITFKDEESASEAQKILESIEVDGAEPLFGEIDQRGVELFVVLTWPNEVIASTTISYHDIEIPLSEWVCFVAIKNGEHVSNGWAFFTKGVAKFAPHQGAHVAKLHKTISDYFSSQRPAGCPKRELGS